MLDRRTERPWTKEVILFPQPTLLTFQKTFGYLDTTSCTGTITTLTESFIREDLRFLGTPVSIVGS